jgi:hypothetical protein
LRGDLTMDKEMSAALMAEFGQGEIGHKPVVWCKQCTDANKRERGATCANHKIIRCPKCATRVTDGHNCLAFVGHADARHRLCLVDPEWTWEPFDFPGMGAVILRDGYPVGLWIRMTVGGVTKPGYGSCDMGKSPGDAMKELIGDAIRNAGQSFGLAWYLWAKGERTPSGDRDGDSQPQSASAAFDNATPAAPRQPNGNGHANGNVTQSPAREQAAAPVAKGEPDDDAQPYADEVHEARTLAALKDINGRAREAHKLASLIRNPTTGGVGGLGQYVGWKKTVLEKAEKSLEILRAAGKQAGLDDAELDREVTALTGHGIEDATAEDMDKAAKAIASALLAGAGRGSDAP